MMLLCGIDGIWSERTLAPGVNTSYTVDVSIDIQIDETSAIYLVGMTGRFQVFLTIVP